MDQMQTADDLQTMRKKAGWSQRQLAERAGVHVQTVKYWEAKTGFIEGSAVERFEEAFTEQRSQSTKGSDLCPTSPFRTASKRRPLCGARNRKGKPCRAKALSGKRRCKFHGGMSTGPKTLKGRNRIAEAQRKRWNTLRAKTP